PPTWAFGFRNADADLDGIIYGTNASILVKGLPVLPWFPILGAAVRKERQTGFLFPAYGTSSRKGYFIEAPFFWSIADNQDLTLRQRALVRGQRQRGFGRPRAGRVRRHRDRAQPPERAVQRLRHMDATLDERHRQPLLVPGPHDPALCRAEPPARPAVPAGSP